MNGLNVAAHAPELIPTIIEIPANQAHGVKYEYDKDLKMIRVDRLMNSAMHYPCHYGFVPNTLSEDGDPLDVLLLCDRELIPGCIIDCRPVGVLDMEDESGVDFKVLAVPGPKVSPAYEHVQDIDDVPELDRQRITHFFEHYKDLDKNKWVKVRSWHGVAKAHEMIQQSLAAAADQA